MVYSYFVPNSSSKFLAQDAEMPRLSEMGWAGGRGLGWDGGEQSKGVVNTDFAIRYTVPNSPSAKMLFSISFSPDTFIPQNKGPLLTHTRDWDPCPLSLFLFKFSSFIIITSLPSSLLASYCRS